MSNNESLAIVIDAGSGTIKAGYAGQDTPKSIFETVIGKPDKTASNTNDSKDAYIGKDIQKLREKQSKVPEKRPIREGVIDLSEFEDFYAIINYTYMNELKTPSSERPLLFLDSPNNSKACREKLCEMAFEDLNVPKFYLINQCVSSLYSTGKTTGLVLESGYEVSTIMPIYEGYPIYDCSFGMKFAGKFLTDYFKELCKIKISDPERLKIFEQCNFNKYKEEYCKLSNEFTEDLKRYRKHLDNNEHIRTLELPDKSKLDIDYERIQVPELLFKPTLWNRQDPSVQGCIDKAINSVPQDLKTEMWNNIVLSGGNTMFPNFKEKMLQELRIIASTNSNIKEIVSKPERRYAAWIGGSIVSSIANFQGYWIEQNEYKESGGGSTIIHRKCF